MAVFCDFSPTRGLWLWRRQGFDWAWIEGPSEADFEEGDAWIQPLGIRHKVLAYSDDYEVLEITLPATYETVTVEW